MTFELKPRPTLSSYFSDSLKVGEFVHTLCYALLRRRKTKKAILGPSASVTTPEELLNFLQGNLSDSRWEQKVTCIMKLESKRQDYLALLEKVLFIDKSITITDLTNLCEGENIPIYELLHPDIFSPSCPEFQTKKLKSELPKLILYLEELEESKQAIFFQKLDNLVPGQKLLAGQSYLALDNLLWDFLCTLISEKNNTLENFIHSLNNFQEEELRSELREVFKDILS